ncbi:unnamed protein product [Caenorhabditis auriculariae]|uniref:Phosphatidylinositol 4-kinase beta n=1 Tax=Caenorhabditis auriculariae TaxID=2777116 RepID=A0A8S1HE81_9PELO|nr:unnamed protein product [Caenorhabditis auriculariae]
MVEKLGWKLSQDFNSSEPPDWLTRMLESNFFDANMAVQYLYLTEEKHVLTYIGKKLTQLPVEEMDFFLPQLLNMYIQRIDVACAIHAYIEKRCKESVHYALQCIWLLERLANVLKNGAKNYDHSEMIRKTILEEYYEMDQYPSSFEFGFLAPLYEPSTAMQHSHSQPDLSEVHFPSNLPRKSASTTISPSPENIFDLVHNYQDRVKEDSVLHPLKDSFFSVQRRFISRLNYIGTKLCSESTKDSKMMRLKHEIALLNLDLPARCWIPFSCDHFILHIPPEECCVLNSREKVPFIMYVEILRIGEKREDASHGNDRKTVSSGQKEKNSDSKDPSAATLSEPFEAKRERIRSGSPYGDNEFWDLVPIIVKTGDDLAQELFTYQLLCVFRKIWEEESVPLPLKPYQIVVTSPNSGLVEPLPDTRSLHQIKASLKEQGCDNPTLLSYFLQNFGPKDGEKFDNAQKKFTESCAAYSLICYFLQLKDRHNGNILLDADGHLIHIDFGFLLSSSPKNLGFETSPFKLTSEMIEVMEGLDSGIFLYFKSIMFRGLIAARKHHERVLSLVQIMSIGSKMPCFRSGVDTVKALKQRFHLSYTDEQLQDLVNSMVESSRDSLTTRLYDNFQYYTNGILKLSTKPEMVLSQEQREAVRRVVEAVGGVDHKYCRNEFNVHRWLVAYENDEELVVKVLKRHLNIRDCTRVEDLAAGNIPVDDELEQFVPITMLGRNHPDDAKVVLFEKTGQIDIGGLVNNVRMSNFMKIKFRMMERLHEKVVEEEKRTGKQGGGVLVMDLQGLEFSTKLLSVLTGPYRIMWGTLFDHYPQLLQQIIVVNAPTYVNLLHQAFSPFLPNDYKEKIIISSEDAANTLPKHIHPSCLPEELGGTDELSPITQPLAPFPTAEPVDVTLNAVRVPAGKYSIQKFCWKAGDVIEFYLQNDNCFHYFMFFSEDDSKSSENWREVSVGCERPALKQIDVWKWTVPFTGYYFIRYGNEGSWLFSITVNTSHFEITENGEKIGLTPLETFVLE